VAQSLDAEVTMDFAEGGVSWLAVCGSVAFTGQ
jgi:hypothetical protein